jgi:hypothetical protein
LFSGLPFVNTLENFRFFPFLPEVVATFNKDGCSRASAQLKRKLNSFILPLQVTYQKVIMAASLKGLSPDMRKYLRVNKLPDIYEVCLKILHGEECSYS